MSGCGNRFLPCLTGWLYLLLLGQAGIALADEPVSPAAGSPPDTQPASWEPGGEPADPGRPGGPPGSRRGPRGRGGGWRDRGEENRPGRPFEGPGRRGEDETDRERHDFLTPAEQQELLEFAAEHFPEVHQRLVHLREQDPADFKRAIRRVGWWMLRLMRMQKHDPEMAEVLIGEQQIEMKLMDLRREYQSAASDRARAHLCEELRQLIERRFDLRQRRIEKEIRDLEARLRESRDRLARQQANRARWIDLDMERTIDLWEGRGHWEESGPPGRPGMRPPPLGDPDAVPPETSDPPPSPTPPPPAR